MQALIFDSVYNPFRGIETYFRVINGSIKKNQKIKFLATNKSYGADEVGRLNLKKKPSDINLVIEIADKHFAMQNYDDCMNLLCDMIA